MMVFGQEFVDNQSGTFNILNTRVIGNTHSWTEGRFWSDWYLMDDKVNDILSKLRKSDPIVGVRCSCTAEHTFTKNECTVLDMEDVLKRGHERVDRETFQVTKYKFDSPHIEEVSLHHGYKGAADLIAKTGERIFPTLIIYNPRNIITTDRVNAQLSKEERNLLDIPYDYNRAEMRIKGPPQAAIAAIIQMRYGLRI
jgi:hypothetical protein